MKNNSILSQTRGENKQTCMYDSSFSTQLHCKTPNNIRADSSFLLVVCQGLYTHSLRPRNFTLLYSILFHLLYAMLCSSIPSSLISISVSLSFTIPPFYLRHSLGWKCTVGWHHISYCLIPCRRRLWQWCVEHLLGRNKQKSKPGNMKKKYCLCRHISQAFMFKGLYFFNSKWDVTKTSITNDSLSVCEFSVWSW